MATKNDKATAKKSSSTSNSKPAKDLKKKTVPVSKEKVETKVATSKKEEPKSKVIVKSPVAKTIAKVETKPNAKEVNKTVKSEPSKENTAKLEAVKKELEGADKKAKPKKQEKTLAPKPQKKDDENFVPEFVNMGPVVRYTDKELDEFKTTINESKKEALEELNMLKERLDDLTNFDYAEESMIYSMHMAEQGSEAMEKEKTYAQIQRINDLLKKLDEAIQRINDKTYGICRVCNILIAKERLMAVPITTLSASYKIHSKCPEDGIDRIEKIRN